MDPENVVPEILKDRSDEFQNCINRYKESKEQKELDERNEKPPYRREWLRAFVCSVRDALKKPWKRVTLEMSYVSTIEKGGRAYELTETGVLTENGKRSNGGNSVQKRVCEDRAVGGGFDVPSDTKHFGSCTIEMRKKAVTMVRDGEQPHFIADTNERQPEHSQMDELYFDDSYIPRASDSMPQYANDTYYQEMVDRFYGPSDSEDDAAA